MQLTAEDAYSTMQPKHGSVTSVRSLHAFLCAAVCFLTSLQISHFSTGVIGSFTSCLLIAARIAVFTPACARANT